MFYLSFHNYLRFGQKNPQLTVRCENVLAWHAVFSHCWCQTLWLLCCFTSLLSPLSVSSCPPGVMGLVAVNHISAVSSPSSLWPLLVLETVSNPSLVFNHVHWKVAPFSVTFMLCQKHLQYSSLLHTSSAHKPLTHCNLLFMNDQGKTVSCIYFKTVSVTCHTSFIYWMVCLSAWQCKNKIEVLVVAESSE